MNHEYESIFSNFDVWHMCVRIDQYIFWFSMDLARIIKWHELMYPFSKFCMKIVRLYHKFSFLIDSVLVCSAYWKWWNDPLVNVHIKTNYMHNLHHIWPATTNWRNQTDKSPIDIKVIIYLCLKWPSILQSCDDKYNQYIAKTAKQLPTGHIFRVQWI